MLQKRIEGSGDSQEEIGLGAPIQDVKWKQRILKKLTEAEAFEKFLHTKYPAAKRFVLMAEEPHPWFGRDVGRVCIRGVEELS